VIQTVTTMFHTVTNTHLQWSLDFANGFSISEAGI